MTATTHAPTRPKGRPLPGANAADDLLPRPDIRRGLRRVHGLTQFDAAELFGVSHQTIGNWEQRRPGPRHMPRYLAQLRKWAEDARAMGYQVDWPATPAKT